MLVRLPRALHYPITITALLKRPDEEVEELAPLFSYSYKTDVVETNRFGEEKTIEKTFPSRFESPVEGVLKEWKVKVGDVLTGSINVAEILEPCPHSVQFGGLCTMCGKDMTQISQGKEVPDSERAQVSIVPDQQNLKVSSDEAARFEEEAKRRLLQSRKLSLVVDLDQTIIHATVDPTVAEWQKDPENPNYPAVKDVRAFQLMDDGPGGGGCWYYIKLRPGLAEFLDRIAELYELHIYTMGTRAYAKAIANIVDPDQRIFGDRILSRDENGSLTTKNLKRIFPTDTKMVIIIDDRGDVWKWSDNLIRVKPYDFFVGIGDINSSFLPKAQIPPPPPEEERPQPSNGETANGQETGEPDGEKLDGEKLDGESLTTLEQLVSMSGGDDPTVLKVQADKQSEAITAQQQDRPLQRQQEQLDAEDAKVEDNEPDKPPSDNGKPRHNLLRDDDVELQYLETSLNDVHRAFYDEYDEMLTAVKPSRVAQLRDGSPRKLTGNGEVSADLVAIPDVKIILPTMKSRVLEGVVIVFSGLVPLGQDVQRSDIASWTRSFGARIFEDVSKAVTHVVAARARTSKVRQAARFKKIKVVNAAWLYDSLSQWLRLDERPYLIPVNEDEENARGSQDDLSKAMLSSSEEGEADLSEFEDGDLYNPEGVSLPDPDEPTSPVDGLKDFDWGTTNDELAEFLGSDADDSDDDSVLSASGRPDKGGKRSRSSSPAEPPPEDQDIVMTDSAVAGEGSRLAKRQKVARNRTTSLREVTSLDSVDAPPASQETNADEDDDDLEAFEREFEAGMAADGDPHDL